MTVCIAALSDKKKGIVLVTDEMVTASIPISVQYETSDVSKAFKVTDNAVIMTAGNALIAHEIVEKTKKKINTDSITSVEDIAEAARQSYQEFRLTLITREVVEPRGLSLETYYEKQKDLHTGIVQEIDQKLTSGNIGVGLIVAGHNDEECHLFSIRNPGSLISHDAIGYACVGIGAPHAMYYLIGSKYLRGMSQQKVKNLVLRAKKKSEVAPGVGKSTKILLLPE